MFPVESGTNRFLSLLSEQKFLVPWNTKKLTDKMGRAFFVQFLPTRAPPLFMKDPKFSLLHLPMDLPEGPQRRFQGATLKQ